MSRPLLSVVLPSYNNGACLPATIRRIRATCPKNTEIVIVVDGSTDQTQHILARFSRRNIRVLMSKKRRGKGAAVRDGVHIARGRYIATIDADMAIDPSYVAQSLEILAKNRRINAVIGRRIVYRTGTVRRIFHTVFHWVEKLLFRMPYHDTQAPMKVFRSSLAKSVFAKLQTRSYAFDIEVLFRAMVHGNGVVELPVHQRKTLSSLKWNLLLFSCIEMLRMYRTYIAHQAVNLVMSARCRRSFLDVYSLRHLVLWPLSWPLLWIAQTLYRFVKEPLIIHQAILPDFPTAKPILLLRHKAT